MHVVCEEQENVSQSYSNGACDQLARFAALAGEANYEPPLDKSGHAKKLMRWLDYRLSPDRCTPQIDVPPSFGGKSGTYPLASAQGTYVPPSPHT